MLPASSLRRTARNSAAHILQADHMTTLAELLGSKQNRPAIHKLVWYSIALWIAAFGMFFLLRSVVLPSRFFFGRPWEYDVDTMNAIDTYSVVGAVLVVNAIAGIYVVDALREPDERLAASSGGAAVAADPKEE